MPWLEKTDGWGFSYNDEGMDGSRVFYEDDDGTIESLPEIGTPFPEITGVDTTPCLLRKVDIDKWGDHPDLELYSLEYSTRTRDDSGDDKNYGQNIPRNIELAGEIIDIGAGGKWEWDSDSAKVEFTGDNALSLTRRIVTGSMTMSRIDSKLELVLISEMIGKVNSDDFPDVTGEPSFPAGIWLFAGAQTTEFWDKNGWQKWKYNYTFLFRSVTGSPSDGKGWNYFWRKTTGTWDRPLLLGVEPVYEEAAYKNLFE